MNRFVVVTLSQNLDEQFSLDGLAKFVREQFESTEISEHCCLEKITVLEDRGMHGVTTRQFEG